MLKPVLLLSALLGAGAPAAIPAQDWTEPTGVSDRLQAEAFDGAIRTYDWCKKDAFDYGVMGTYRRLYILSCVGDDLTAAIPVNN